MDDLFDDDASPAEEFGYNCPHCEAEVFDFADGGAAAVAACMHMYTVHADLIDWDDTGPILIDMATVWDDTD